ncbi:MAG TPA: acylneuraminate cytidylyltransferase [Firmicutes bacterium]|jgi:spore coat polysaccharide biosynthesis protein SpsF|nr:acylneuraminate cytidylyltransferase [Bacillota bacterium]
MTTAIIVQARIASTRLPGKILKRVLGKTLLEYELERLSRVKSADQLIIATTDHGEEQPIIDLCRKLETPYFRGSEQDVLARYYGAATESGADVVVRITSDCPLIDPVVVDKVISFYLTHQTEYDYVSNTFPELTYPRGMDTEVFSKEVLKEAYEEAIDQEEREHVTIFIKRRPERYRIKNLLYTEDFSHYRWTVDTSEDFELIKRMLATLYPTNPNFTLEDCLTLLTQYPEWAKINEQIKQKLVK